MKVFFFTVDSKFGPDVSLNEYIQTVVELRGTKAMCNEGGCGACIVSVIAACPPDYVHKISAVNSLSDHKIILFTIQTYFSHQYITVGKVQG